MSFVFKKFHKTPDHMNLELFRSLDSMSGLHNGHFFISSNEETILDNYDDIRKLLEDSSVTSVTVVAHCADAAMPHNDLVTKLEQVKKDLNRYKNFKFVLIAGLPYHWEINFNDHCNFLYIFYPEYQGIYWPLYKNELPLGPRPIKKHFLSLNKRADVYRQILYYTFDQNNWIEKSHFSYLGEDYIHGNLYSEKRFLEIDARIKSSKYFKNLMTPTKKFLSLHNDTFLESYQNNYSSGLDPTWNIDHRLYKESFCSIIVESSPTNRIINLSEKTFRAITYKHPFLLFGSENTHRFLIQDLGIDLGIYNDVIANWDTGINNDQRFENFIKFITKIANLTVDDLTVINNLLDNKTSYLRDQYRHVYDQMMSKQNFILHSVKKFSNL